MPATERDPLLPIHTSNLNNNTRIHRSPRSTQVRWQIPTPPAERPPSKPRVRSLDLVYLSSEVLC